MTLRKTIFLIGDTGDIFTVTIYTDEDFRYERGLWHVDTNKIVLTEKVYQQFDALDTAREQRAFFDDLHKISGVLI